MSCSQDGVRTGKCLAKDSGVPGVVSARLSTMSMLDGEPLNVSFIDDGDATLSMKLTTEDGQLAGEVSLYRSWREGWWEIAPSSFPDDVRRDATEGKDNNYYVDALRTVVAEAVQRHNAAQFFIDFRYAVEAENLSPAELGYLKGGERAGFDLNYLIPVEDFAFGIATLEVGETA